MPREVPILNLEQVGTLAISQSPAHDYFHAFGVLIQESTKHGATYWTIFDEYKAIEIRLKGQLTEYPRPKPGDVIRIHRLTINKVLKTAEIVNARNVVIWPAYQHSPKPKSTARSPTISEEDDNRRRQLEVLFASKIDRISEFRDNLRNSKQFFNVAGAAKEAKLDTFGHLEVEFTDGTGSFFIRIFDKKFPEEIRDHFDEAKSLSRGDLFVATNVKLDTSGKRLNLSANHVHGKSFRHVEKASILGVLLSQSLGHNEAEPAVDQPSTEDIDHGTNEAVASSQPNTRRRSPRLMQQQQQQGSQQSNSSPSSQEPTRSGVPVDNNQAQSLPPPPAPLQNGTTEALPAYTQFSAIRPREPGYDFYDIVGQVRQIPKFTANYGNYVLQLYDGSPHNHSSYYAPEFGDDMLERCLVLYVYSKQKESDTDEHIEKAKTLKDGDLIFVKNAKVSFRDSKIKLELNANKNHNKSITVIDKNSNFGKRLLDIIETPDADEFREMIGSSSSSFLD